MAEKIRGITIEIGGDTKGLTKALQGVNKEIKGTEKQLKDVERLLKLDPKNTELLAQKQQLLAKAADESAKKVKELHDIEKKMVDAGVDKNSEQFQALRREIIEAEKNAKDAEKALRDFGSVNLQKLEASLSNIGDKATAAGKALTKNVTAPIVGGFVAATKVTADFDKSMSQVAAVSGATGEDFDALRDKAREMGAETKFSASEAADAMNYMAMAGWKTEQMLNGIDGIMALAAASGEDLATTSDIVTDALTAFGMGAEDASRFADILAAASANANTNVGMLGESFKYVAPVAGAMGYNAEDISIALGLMANSGIKASQAGTSLRNILTRMAKPTKESATAMEVLGLSLDDGEGNMKSFMEIMEDFRKGFGQIQIPVSEFETSLAQLDEAFDNGEMSEKAYEEALNELVTRAYGAEGANKAMYASMLAGARGMSGLLAIVNTSDEDFKALTDSIYNCDGAAEDMADIMQDNLAGQLEILKSQLEELAISVGDILMPILRDIVGAIQKFVDWLNNMGESTKTAIVTILAIVAAIGPLLVVIGKIATGLAALLKIWPAIKAIGIAVNTFAMTNPIILIMAAIIALVALIATKGDEIKALLQKVDDFFQNIFAKDFTEIFGPVLGNIINGFIANIKNIWDSIKKVFDGIIDFIKGVFSGDWQRAWNGIKQIFQGAFEGLLAAAKAPLNGIIGFINILIDGINSFIDKINSIRIKVPDWVPVIGGGSFGFKIGHLGKIPYLAKGGVLEQGSAIVGEAGPEIVTMNAGKAIVQPLNSSNSTTNVGGINITVYGAPGQDVQELADIIMDEIQAATERRSAALA